MSPTESDNRTFEAPLEEVRDAASDALAGLGADVQVSDDGRTVSGKTGWSLMSFFGERVEINLEPQGDNVLASVMSRQSRGQLLDLGSKNKRNVASVINAMTTRLRS